MTVFGKIACRCTVAPEDNNGLIFTWRKPVSDAAGRPGYCAVAVALSEGAAKAPAKVHGWLKGSAASLVNELYKFGLTSAQGRFVAQPHELTSFVEERSKAFGISDPAGAFDSQKQVQIANSRHVDYYMNADVFEQILKSNWLQLACAQLEGNVFFFEATREPRMDDVRLLNRSGVEDLARRARLRLEFLKSVPSQASGASVPATLSPPLTSSVRDDHKEAKQPSATAIAVTSNKESENLSHENTNAIASANLERQLEEVWRELRAMDERVLSLDKGWLPLSKAVRKNDRRTHRRRTMSSDIKVLARNGPPSSGIQILENLPLGLCLLRLR